ncbi:hypothetical protein OZX57_01515 [Bifidobacterium sp. ESL0682]|nr:hypothetical protein [Bifidobacterium sp. ESL0682]WEV42202.1 hypothetical protein OZX57_01515 [Bifidobacterium sp. ESL0682]
MNMNGLDSFDHVTLENRDFSDFQVDLAHDCTEVMRNYLIGKFPSVKL